jgi:hypothetical protein
MLACSIPAPHNRNRCSRQSLVRRGSDVVASAVDEHPKGNDERKGPVCGEKESRGDMMHVVHEPEP